jgi:methyl-accepting chemotaxis protein
MGFTKQRNYSLLLYAETFGIVVVGAAIAGWGVFWSFPAGLGEGYHNTLAAVQAIQKVLFWKIAMVYAVIGIPCIPAIAVLHLFYSHRIAGPVYRVGLEASRIGQGDLSGKIKFRPKDNLEDMADMLNNVASQYRGRIMAVKDCLAVIDVQSKTISGLIDQGKDGAELKRAAEEITNNVKNIERSLSEMRT